MFKEYRPGPENKYKRYLKHGIFILTFDIFLNKLH